MKKELDEKLCKDFPLLFEDRHADMRMTAMCWGFPGTGWEPLIRRLAEKLEKMIREGILDGSWTEENHPRASQVKEKFAGLRFYMSYSTDAIEDLIDDAENESYRTCEECGEPGEVRKDGWMVTLCDACNDSRDERRKGLWS